MPIQERSIREDILEAVRGITHRRSTAEVAARESLVQEYVFEALDVKPSDIKTEWQLFEIQQRINDAHSIAEPGRFWGSATNATSSELKKALKELEKKRLVASREVRPEGKLYRDSRAIPPLITLWGKVQKVTATGLSAQL
jgi:hypothetical protein